MMMMTKVIKEERGFVVHLDFKLLGQILIVVVGNELKPSNYLTHKSHLWHVLKSLQFSEVLRPPSGFTMTIISRTCPNSAVLVSAHQKRAPFKYAGPAISEKSSTDFAAFILGSCIMTTMVESIRTKHVDFLCVAQAWKHAQVFASVMLVAMCFSKEIWFIDRWVCSLW